MTIKEIRALTGLTQKQFAEKYHITFSSIRNWESGHRTCPDYVLELLEFKVKEDLKMDMYNLINKEVKIDGREGEITNILGCAFEVTFFNVNDGKTIIYPEDIEKYLVED